MVSASQGRELLQLISEGYIFIDKDYVVRDINEVGLKMANRPLSDFIGRRLWDIAPHLVESEIPKLWAQAMAGTHPVSVEHYYRWMDGHESWLEMRGHPTDGGLAIFYRDISDQKRSEEELKRAQSELMQASRLSAMGTMAATLAHELAQPLTAATNALDTSAKMLRGVPDARAREARHGLELASGSIRRAAEIVRRLRSFVAKGKVEAETQDLSSMIADASVMMVPQAQREGVEIDFQLNPRARWVKADAVQIQQVLINLVRNAIEAMRESPQKRICIATRVASARLLEVSIEDSGPGLDDATAETLFVPFHSSKPEGLGVGLSLCRTIIEAHGGTIHAAPRPGGGARFSFTLLRAEPPEEE